MIRIPRPATTARAAAVILMVLAFAAFAFGQRAKPKTPSGVQPASAPKPLEMSYKLAFPQPHTHLYEVSLTIDNVTTPQLDLSLPIWTPGSYLAREYARHVQDFNADDGSERPLPWRKIDKATWRIETAASGDSQKTVRVSYRVYANDLATIVEEGAKIFGGLPYDHYTFIVHIQPGIGGGTEHLNSNVSMTRPEAFKSDRGYKGFLGLESHEYFHHWNVKRIRPLALGPFDYQRENYTRGLWVSEGVTSYYGDLLLRRAGLIGVNEYLDGLANTVARYDQTRGCSDQQGDARP